MSGISGGDSMGLVQMCEELLQYVCAINRDRRRDGHRPLSADSVRRDIKTIFNRLDADLAQASTTLQNQWNQPAVGGNVRKMLHYFVDDIIDNSRLEFRDQWEPISYEDYGEAYKEDFWHVVDKDLQSPPDHEVDERLTLYYVLIGLGFQGYRAGDDAGPQVVEDRLKAEMDRICDRVAALKKDRGVQSLKQFLGTTEEQLQVEGNHPPQLPSRDIWLICVLVLGFIVVMVVVANWWLYFRGIDDLTRTLTSFG